MRSPLLAAAALAAVHAPLWSAPAALQEEGSKEKEQRKEAFEVGDTVDPEITLPDITGRKHKLGKYRGKVVVVDFWSIQCPWSKKYEPVLIELHEKFAPKDVVFLAVNANHREVDWDAEKPYARIREYAEEAEVPYPILIDEGNAVADRFGGKTTPHAFVIDKEGVLVYAGGVDDRFTKKDDAAEVTHWLRDAIAATLAGKPVPVKETKPFGCTIKRAKPPTIQ